MDSQSAPEVAGRTERAVGARRAADPDSSELRSAGDAPGVRSRTRALGQMLVIEAWGSGSEIERRPLPDGKHTTDLVFVQQGTLSYLDRGEWVRSNGTLLISPGGMPQRIRCAGQWKLVIARIPRIEGGPASAERVIVHRDLTGAELELRSQLVRLLHDEAAVPDDPHTALEMASAVVRDRQQRPAPSAGPTPPAGPAQSVLCERALGVIVKYAASVNLTPPQIARELGVSLRHLQAVFASSGSSVAAELRRERVRLACEMLHDEAFDGHSVDAIAAAAGFGSGVTMRRALRETYQLSPKQLRRERSVRIEVPRVRPAEVRRALAAPSMSAAALGSQ